MATAQSVSAAKSPRRASGPFTSAGAQFISAPDLQPALLTITPRCSRSGFSNYWRKPPPSPCTSPNRSPGSPNGRAIPSMDACWRRRTRAQGLARAEPGALFLSSAVMSCPRFRSLFARNIYVDAGARALFKQPTRRTRRAGLSDENVPHWSIPLGRSGYGRSQASPASVNSSERHPRIRLRIPCESPRHFSLRRSAAIELRLTPRFLYSHPLRPVPHKNSNSTPPCRETRVSSPNKWDICRRPGSPTNPARRGEWPGIATCTSVLPRADYPAFRFVLGKKPTSAPSNDTFRFGEEICSIADHIVPRQGFSSPFHLDTGPPPWVVHRG